MPRPIIEESWRRPGLVLLALSLLSGCGDDGSGAGGPVFAENYAETYTEVRNCRPNGGSHDFNQIRVVASPEAVGPYRDRDAPFPVGAVVIKEEYQAGDTDCTGELVQWSAMERVSESRDEMLGWRWQQVDFTRTVVAENATRCFGCHADCYCESGCSPTDDGYLGTCTVE